MLNNAQDSGKADDNGNLDKVSKAKVNLGIAQINEYLSKLPNVITKQELQSAVNNEVGKSLDKEFQKQFDVFNKMLSSQTDRMNDMLSTVLKHSEEHVDKKIETLNKDYDKLESEIKKLSEIANRTYGAVDKYIQNQETLSNKVNDEIVRTKSLNDKVKEIERQLETQARLGEQATFLDRVHDLEITTKLDYAPRLIDVENKILKIDESQNKFIAWESSASIYQLLFIVPIYKLNSNKNKLNNKIKCLFKRIISYIKQQMILKVLLALVATILGTGLFSEFVNLINKAKILETISQIFNP